jgi:hypothetical protein
MIEKWLECHQHLLEGEYDDWWPRHEWIRTGSADAKDRFELTPTFGKPVWDGRKAPFPLLVNADFGMGDTIHFYRFIQEAKRRLYCLVLRCDEDFKTLFTERGIPVIGKEEPLSHFTHVIHMMALPHVLGVKKADINGEPYICPNPSCPMTDCALQSVLSASRSSKIGVCWKGNPFNPRDSVRSLSDKVIERFLWGFDPRMHFFSFNKVDPPPEKFIDCRLYMTDWNQTAWLLEQMDLVISVDTAVAHLAGAMGKKVWLLLDEDVDWRWGRDGTRTIWYDSMRIFRRTSTWEEVIDRVAANVLMPSADYDW